MNIQKKLLKEVHWQDLVQLNQKDIFFELLISLPWLGLSLVFAYLTWYPLALLCSFMFFLT